MSLFDKPKQVQTKVKLGDKRFYLGIEGYKKPCTIEELVGDDKVHITIGARFYHNIQLKNIGELCS